ncbi:MFS transporter [Streptomyces sp. SM1P]
MTSRTAGTLGGRKQIALLVLCAQLFLDSMDVSLMGVALPELKDDLGLSAEELQWIISGYAVAYGGFLLLGGRAADLFGRRRMFFWGTAVFAVASLAGGFVSDGTLLIVSRVIKGVAAAFIAPAALSIIMTTFKEGPERNRAVGIFSLTGASGYAAGLVLSGVLTELNWRLTFFVPFVIAALVLAAVRYAVSPDPVRDGERPGFDAFGAVTATGGVLLLVFALTRAPEVGWGSAATVLSLVASVALLVAFVIIQNRRAEPLVQLSIFRSRTLSTANVVGLTWASATIGWQFVALLYLQQVLDYSALGAGAAIVPMAAAILVTVNVTPRVINRFGLRVPAVAGLLLQGLGILLFLRADESSEYVTVLLPALILHGIGNGLSFPSFNVAGVSGVADEQQGLATSSSSPPCNWAAGSGSRWPPRSSPPAARADSPPTTGRSWPWASSRWPVRWPPHWGSDRPAHRSRTARRTPPTLPTRRTDRRAPLARRMPVRMPVRERPTVPIPRSWSVRAHDHRDRPRPGRRRGAARPRRSPALLRRDRRLGPGQRRPAAPADAGGPARHRHVGQLLPAGPHHRRGPLRGPHRRDSPGAGGGSRPRRLPLDIRVDGILAHRWTGGPGRHRVAFPLPVTDGTPADVEVWLPHLAVTRIGAVTLRGHRHLLAAERTGRRLLVHGSSLTHCMYAAGPSETWPALVAAEHGWRLRNLGFAGRRTWTRWWPARSGTPRPT